jgi:hypothetical protein
MKDIKCAIGVNRLFIKRFCMKNVIKVVGIIIIVAIVFSMAGCGRICDTCGGSGKCQVCGGDGELNDKEIGRSTIEVCDVCHGSGKCKECGGKGKDPGSGSSGGHDLW